MRRATHRQQRLRRESRTISIKGTAIHGTADDNKKYYRCWYCGFPCNVDRDALGNANSTTGQAYQDALVPALGTADSNDSYAPLARVSGIGHSHVVHENGADGNPKGVYHYHKHVTGSGCPNCGTLNWRGDFP